jgi:hypothetical protein
MLRNVAVCFALGCLIVLSGCGKAKPKYTLAPLEESTTATTGNEAKPSDGAAADVAATAADGDGKTPEESATGEPATPAEPEVPAGPRPSLLVKVMTDPLQDALQSNMAALQAVIGTVTKQAGVGAVPAAEPAKPADEAKPTEEAKPADESKPVEEAKPADEAKPAEPEATPN